MIVTSKLKLIIARCVADEATNNRRADSSTWQKISQHISNEYYEMPEQQVKEIFFKDILPSLDDNNYGIADPATLRSVINWSSIMSANADISTVSSTSNDSVFKKTNNNITLESVEVPMYESFQENTEASETDPLYITQNSDRESVISNSSMEESRLEETVIASQKSQESSLRTTMVAEADSSDNSIRCESPDLVIRSVVLADESRMMTRDEFSFIDRATESNDDELQDDVANSKESHLVTKDDPSFNVQVASTQNMSSNLPATQISYVPGSNVYQGLIMASSDDSDDELQDDVANSKESDLMTKDESSFNVQVASTQNMSKESNVPVPPSNSGVCRIRFFKANSKSSDDEMKSSQVEVTNSNESQSKESDLMTKDDSSFNVQVASTQNMSRNLPATQISYVPGSNVYQGLIMASSDDSDDELQDDVANSKESDLMTKDDSSFNVQVASTQNLSKESNVPVPQELIIADSETSDDEMKSSQDEVTNSNESHKTTEGDPQKSSEENNFRALLSNSVAGKNVYQGLIMASSDDSDDELQDDVFNSKESDLMTKDDPSFNVQVESTQHISKKSNLSATQISYVPGSNVYQGLLMASSDDSDDEMQSQDEVTNSEEARVSSQNLDEESDKNLLIPFEVMFKRVVEFSKQRKQQSALSQLRK